MAVKSGMIYSKVQSLVESLTQHLNEINDIFDNELVASRIPEIAENYSGEAAEAYKTNLTNVSRRINQDVQDIINKLSTEAKTQQEAYNRQSKSLVQNVNVNN